MNRTKTYRSMVFGVCFFIFVSVITAIELCAINLHVSNLSASLKKLQLFIGEDASRYPDMERTVSALGIATMPTQGTASPLKQCELREKDDSGQVLVVATGSQFCVQHIQSIITQHERLRKTAYVPVFLLLTSILLVILPAAAKALSYIAPFIFLMLSLAFLMPCVTCQESFALPATSGVALIFLAALSAMGVWRMQGRKCLWNIALSASLFASLSVQAAFYWLEPKACPWCIASSVLFMSIIIYIANNESKDLGSIVIGPRIIKVFGCCALIVTVVQAFSFSGYALSKAPPSSEEMPSPVGKNYSYYENSGTLEWKDPLNVVIVTIPGCRACDMAMDALRRENIPFRTVRPCSILSKSRCFNTRKQPISTPYILGVDTKGTIRFAHSGWPDSAIDVDFIIQSIRKMRGGNVNENPKTLSTEHRPKHS